MRVSLPQQSRVVKRILPRSLLGRSLLIILIPLVIVQAVALQIFYGSHLDIVSRRFAGAVAGEITTNITLLNRMPDATDQAWVMQNSWDQYEIAMHLRAGATLPPAIDEERHFLLGSVLGAVAQRWLRENALTVALHDRIDLPLEVDWTSDPQSVVVHVQTAEGVLDIEVPRKRLYTGTIYLFVLWIVGASLLLFGIAALFMRNQVRAIRRLAAAAEAFGLGRDQGPIKPEGASEVRQAATAFNRMQERIRRFLQQRTEMLAGVSHDLRTPLTRLRLALAMLPAEGALAEDVSEMTADVEEMERMVGGYIAFARGEGAEQAHATDLSAVLADVVANARRSGAAINLSVPPSLVLKLRPDAVRRAVTNLVDNASRHARTVSLGARLLGERGVLVTVDDDGPGIALDRREDVFRPFASGAAGGTGLGLTIARDIVRAHGGDITLEDSPLGGLRARIMLPI